MSSWKPGTQANIAWQARRVCLLYGARKKQWCSDESWAQTAHRRCGLLAGGAYSPPVHLFWPESVLFCSGRGFRAEALCQWRARLLLFAWHQWRAGTHVAGQEQVLRGQTTLRSTAQNWHELIPKEPGLAQQYLETTVDHGCHRWRLL